MTKATKFDITATYLLVPMAVMAFTMVCFFAFQSTQVLKERDGLTKRAASLVQAYGDSQKVNSQFGGLVMGTQKLAAEGSASAKSLAARLMQIGILPDPSKLPSKAPVPAAGDAAKGPVKP